MKITFPTFLAHPCHDGGPNWVVSGFNANAVWDGSSKPVSKQEAIDTARKARRKLNRKK